MPDALHVHAVLMLAACASCPYQHMHASAGMLARSNCSALPVDLVDKTQALRQVCSDMISAGFAMTS